MSWRPIQLWRRRGKGRSYNAFCHAKEEESPSPFFFLLRASRGVIAYNLTQHFLCAREREKREKGRREEKEGVEYCCPRPRNPTILLSSLVADSGWDGVLFQCAHMLFSFTLLFPLILSYLHIFELPSSFLPSSPFPFPNELCQFDFFLTSVPILPDLFLLLLQPSQPVTLDPLSLSPSSPLFRCLLPPSPSLSFGAVTRCKKKRVRISLSNGGRRKGREEERALLEVEEEKGEDAKWSSSSSYSKAALGTTSSSSSFSSSSIRAAATREWNDIGLWPSLLPPSSSSSFSLFLPVWPRGVVKVAQIYGH